VSAPVITDAIDLVFSPGGAPERATRRRIRNGGDAAAMKAHRTQHPDAHAIRCAASNFAHRRTLAPASLDELNDAIRCLAYLALAAGLMERLEAGDA
jgi:hypothetical protein